METLDDYLMRRPPTAARPLLGVTVLVVEDSRFACEAMRLMCLRSGARIRRADSLDHARRHLRVYRPTCVIVDLGLPDGKGEDLIADLSRAQPRIEVILGTSGDPDAEGRAIAAGADGFLAKPYPSLGAFQQAILASLPEERRPRGPRPSPGDAVLPDRLALRDDFENAARVLDHDDSAARLDYVAQFIAGIARSAGDDPMEEAAESLIARRAAGFEGRAERARVSALVHDRLSEAAPF